MTEVSPTIEPGHSVIVTGAGAGLGRGVALAFAAHGARVVIAARGENGRETERLVRERGQEALFVPCDVTDRAAVERMAAATVEWSGRIDTIIHNAVSGHSSDITPLEEADLELWHAHSAVSLRGGYYLAQVGLPHLAASKGRLILVTSSQGVEGSGPMPLYASVKAALRAMTKSLAKEWAPLGINVTAVSPLVMTDSIKRWFADPKNAGHEERLRGIVPLGYIGLPEEDVAPPFLFLAGGASHYVTGQILTVDGGRNTL